MKKMNEFMYQRRGFGANTRLDPLIGKSPSSAGVPPRSTKPKTLMSQSLLKGNSIHNNKLKAKDSNPKVMGIDKGPNIDEKIVIKVTDERKNINKSFEWRKSLLLKEMKYFEKHLKSSDSAEDIDISVHWDVTIFEWLMNFIHGRGTKLTKQNVIPILISAEFLIIRRLIEEWLDFIINNISDVVKVPIDMGWLSQGILKKLADSMTIKQLDAFKDPKDSLQSKLYSHKLDDLLKIEKNKLSRWIHWNILYTEEQSKWMTCPKAGIFIDYRGRVIADHFPDSNWKIEEFFNYLKKNNVSWRRIFWKVWARLITDECTVWGQKFVLSECDNCTYHPESPQFLFGSNNGTYPCWEVEAVRFSTGVHTGGCKNKRHTFKNLKSDSTDYYFLTKHYEILKEPVIKNSPENISKNEEIKTELKSENEIEDLKSLPQVIKPKLMSLLTLVKEFASGKYLKLMNYNCLDCAQLGSCWNKCLIMEDEDDDTPDFNFVLPKKLKPATQSKLNYFVNNFYKISHKNYLNYYVKIKNIF